MTRLRQMMLDELQRRNYSSSTIRSYIRAVEDFARYFGRSPHRLGPDHIRQYQVHLFRERKLSAGTAEGRTVALRFLFVKTLKRPYIHDQIPFPKRQRPLPTVLSQDEVAHLIDSYGTGVRRAELCQLKIADMDSQLMVIRVRQGKRARPRPRSTRRADHDAGAFGGHLLRADILARVLPRTRIADRCRLESSHLEVQGQLGRYRISLALGLTALVADSGLRWLKVPQKLLAAVPLELEDVPIELDYRTEMILRKSYLLADDWKIENPELIG